MRIGSNPKKDNRIYSTSASHRVIMPVYIPNSEGYFKDSFEVLKVSLSSLFKTINSDTKISIVSNGSSIEVVDYLKEIFNKGLIDRLVINKENEGKMNALITESRASFENYLTYTDADVFFDKDWLFNTFQVFKNVRKAGYVSMNPTPMNFTYANSTLLYNFLRFNINKKTVGEVCTYSDLNHFHASVGRSSSFTKDMMKKRVCTIGKWNYIIGAGHFCCTVKKDIFFDFIPKNKSNIAASGGSESLYLDLPFDKSGFYKLSSPKAYVWHLGNSLDDDWSQEKLKQLINFKEVEFSFNSLSTIKSISFIPYNYRVLVIKVLRKLKFFD